MISEELLKQAAEEAAQAMPESLPTVETDHAFSSEFEEKMQKLCKKAERPRVYTFLKHAACAVLAIVLLGGALMLNTEVRASIVGWISEQYCGFTRYYFDEPADVDRRRFVLRWIPEGYAVADTLVTEDNESFIYKKNGEPTIFFSYSYGSSTTIFVEEKEHIKTQIVISGNVAELFIPIDQENASVILWTDREYGVLFYISSNCDKDMLINIAKNVCVVK